MASTAFSLSCKIKRNHNPPEQIIEEYNYKENPSSKALIRNLLKQVNTSSADVVRFFDPVTETENRR